jgi:hypothetical protein
MPEVLRRFLRELPIDPAREVWDWLDGEPDALYLMIKEVVDSHFPIAAARLRKKS